MILVEMYGCPGSGKTTISNAVIEKLRLQGYKIADTKNIYYSGNLRNYKILLLLKIILDRKNWRLYSLIFKVGLKYGVNFENLKYIGYLMILSYQLTAAFKFQRYDVIFLDEGMVQYVSSLMHTKQIIVDKNLENLINEILFKIGNIYLINCVLDLKINIQRLRSRGNKKVTRFIRVDDDQLLLSMLRIKRKNLDSLAKLFSKSPVLEIDMMELENINTETVVQFIEMYLGASENKNGFA